MFCGTEFPLINLLFPKSLNKVQNDIYFCRFTIFSRTFELYSF